MGGFSMVVKYAISTEKNIRNLQKSGSKGDFFLIINFPTMKRFYILNDDITILYNLGLSQFVQFLGKPNIVSLSEHILKRLVLELKKNSISFLIVEYDSKRHTVDIKDLSKARKNKYLLIFESKLYNPIEIERPVHRFQTNSKDEKKSITRQQRQEQINKTYKHEELIPTRNNQSNDLKEAQSELSTRVSNVKSFKKMLKRDKPNDRVTWETHRRPYKKR